MKYYVYVSKSKIEMLFAQVSRSEQERREAFLGFDIGLFEGGRKKSRGIPDNVS